MLENLRTARRFNSLLAIFIVSALFFFVHLGFFLDIPYIPATLCFKAPAMLVLSLAYYLSMFTLRSIKVKDDILKRYGHRVMRE